MQLQRQATETGLVCVRSGIKSKQKTTKQKTHELKGLLLKSRGGEPTGAAYTIPKLTVSLILPLSSSSLSVSADSRDVAAMSRPNARWDMKRRDASSASVWKTVGITTFMYMLPSYDRMDASARKTEDKDIWIHTQYAFKYMHKKSEVVKDGLCLCVCEQGKSQIPPPQDKVEHYISLLHFLLSALFMPQSRSMQSKSKHRHTRMLGENKVNPI